MLELIFTIDYEIFGNGEGSLRNHVLEPTRQLQKIFDRYAARLVIFVEAAELEIINQTKSDSVIAEVEQQVRALYADGHEIALHLHPQWYNGAYKNGKWVLNNSEYNLCNLQEQRIVEIIDRAINYLKSILTEPSFAPFSFRAGNWLFQPTQPAANILHNRGVKIDSSVFKGGLQHQHHLDYRPAIKNDYFWKFRADVNTPDANGSIIEIPIYTEMVLPWQMATKKRLGIQQKSAAGHKTLKTRMNRIRDLARPLHPLKLDFCRMTFNELTGMMEKIIKDDQKTPNLYKPVAAIGHTKDLVDFETVEKFLLYLHKNKIVITTFKEAYKKITVNQQPGTVKCWHKP